MPIIKSAKKKMRKDASRTERNKIKKDSLKSLTKAMRRKPTKEAFASLSSALDKSVKTNLIHKNKSARLKSRLSRLLSPVK